MRRWAWALLLIASAWPVGAQGLSTQAVDLTHAFFSRRASWMTLHTTGAPATLRVVFSRMQEEKGNLLELTFTAEDGRVAPVAFTATPSHISVATGGAGTARATAYIASAFDAVVDSDGLGLDIASLKPELTLTACTTAAPVRCSASIDGWTVTLDVAHGVARRDGDRWRLAPASGRLLAAIRMHRGPAPAPMTANPARDLEVIDDDWRAFRTRMPSVPATRLPMAEAAWWNLWSLQAPADTHLRTDAVLVAKAEMNAVWAWDHCFPALALGLTDAQAGFEQLVLPFYNADEHGQLPDVTSPDALYLGVTKPPIHGWALGKLMDRHTLSTAQLADFYPQLAKWTQFWFTRRDTDGNGFPEYGGEHSGWDSGWDNATVLGNPTTKYETPELQAYLVLQMKTLARVARQLGRAEDAAAWDSRAERHLEGLMARFWDGEHFLVRPIGGTVITRPTSLLNLMPLVLGEHLPADVFARMADDLERRFLTPFGPATEAPASPLYVADGYWRGPIWAPSTYLLVDGLGRGGRMDLAREIARRFSDLTAHAGGYYENYDALSGKGLRTRGFAWTSAVDILLMHEYLLTPAPR